MLVSINEVNLRRARLVLRWVTVSGVQLPVRENLSQYKTSHFGQLSLAFPPWIGAMSTSQMAVMLCSWGVKAGMVRERVASIKLQCDTLAIAGHIAMSSSHTSVRLLLLSYSKKRRCETFHDNNTRKNDNDKTQ